MPQSIDIIAHIVCPGYKQAVEKKVSSPPLAILFDDLSPFYSSCVKWTGCYKILAWRE